MKKLITMMLGLSLMLGATAVAFGEDKDKPASDTSKKSGKKKGGKKKSDTTTTDKKPS